MITLPILIWSRALKPLKSSMLKIFVQRVYRRSNCFMSLSNGNTLLPNQAQRHSLQETCYVHGHTLDLYAVSITDMCQIMPIMHFITPQVRTDINQRAVSDEIEILTCTNQASGYGEDEHSGFANISIVRAYLISVIVHEYRQNLKQIRYNNTGY